MKYIMIIILSLILALGVSGFAFMNTERFGNTPSGKKLERIKKTSHYKNGSFQNQSPTSVMAEDARFFSMMKLFFTAKMVKPSTPIPSVKHNLHSIARNDDVIVWFGHSSCFIQTDGKRYLIDPVFSKNASPVFFTTKAFDGTNVYGADEIPEIDYLIITHDHWDHLDYKTVKALQPKIKNIICGLGVGEHFERWGFKPEIIIENDWYETHEIDSTTSLRILPARHFSGRGLNRNQSLWISVLIESSTHKIFVSGDSGYDKHFSEIGKLYGPIDIAILENGQYNNAWRYIHMLPYQTLQAAIDLRAKNILPVHNSKFPLSVHTWWEPMQTLCSLAEQKSLPIITPKIGELWKINDSSKIFEKWWEQTVDFKNYK